MVEKIKKVNKLSISKKAGFIISIILFIIGMTYSSFYYFGTEYLFPTLCATVFAFVCSLFDINDKSIPNLVFIIGAPVGFVIFLCCSCRGISQALTTFVAAVVVTVVLGIIGYVTKQRIGYGDALMFGCLTLMLGFMDSLLLLFFSFFYSIIVVSVFRIYSEIRSKSIIKEVPFAPIILAAVILV